MVGMISNNKIKLTKEEIINNKDINKDSNKSEHVNKIELKDDNILNSIQNIMKQDIEIGRNCEKYGLFGQAKNYYLDAVYALDEIDLLKIRHNKISNQIEKGIILIKDTMNNRDRELFEDIKKEIEIRNLLRKNIERIDEKIIKEFKKGEDKFYETLLRREDLYPPHYE